jgi:alpha-beta hydrolase superfamily lysophospholipase
LRAGASQYQRFFDVNERALDVIIRFLQEIRNVCCRRIRERKRLVFESFQLKSCGKGLLGYRWEAANPAVVVCLIHGVGGHAGQFERLAEIFKTRGISTFSFDLRGHGGSVGPRGCTGPRTTVIKDVDSLVAHAHNAHENLPIVLYGHSLGGNIALDYRLRGRLSALPAAYLVASPWLRLYRDVPAFFYWIAKAVAEINPDFILSAGISAELLGNEQIIAAGRGDKLLHNCISVQTASESYGIAEDLMNGRIADRHGGGKKPLFLMHGTADRICSIEATRAFAAAQGAHCVLTEWEGYLHELHNGGKDVTGEAFIESMADIILGFSRSHSAGQA